MKNQSLLFATAAMLILPSGNSVFAADEAPFSGSIEVGGRIGDGEDEGAKAQEYQDLSDGVIGNVNLNYDTDDYFLGFEGTNIGMDDQYYQLKGRSYGKFKYSLFYDELPHNLSFDAYSFYSGVGSGFLYIDDANPKNQDTWKKFDYDIKRKNYGGNFGLTLASPYFFNVEVDRVEQGGLKPLGSGSFSGMVEMPEPVDYVTNNLNVIGGYRSDDLSIKVSGLYSTFDNSNNYLAWQNPFLGITEYNSLAPDNDYARLGLDLTWRKLPWNSTLVLTGSYTSLTGSFSQDQVGAEMPAGLNETTFDGDVSTTNFSATYASHPADMLDTRVFYKYDDRNNDSTVIEYNGEGNDEFLIDYSKQMLGFDAKYRFSSETSLDGGYTFANIDRTNRDDGTNSKDNRIFFKLKNTSIENVTAKLEYTYLNRDTDEDFDLTGLTPYDADYIRPFVSRYDVASKSMNAIKLALEYYPLERLGLGVSYRYVDNDYDDVTLGRTSDKGHELYGDVTWQASKLLTLSGFVGYEKYQADSNHYNFSPGQIADPTIDDGNSSSYRWTQGINQDFWSVGLTALMPLIKDRLMLSLSWNYQNSDGNSDFTTEGPNELQPINKYEDYYINTIEAKAQYAMTETMDLTVGYIYEKSIYEDQQYLDYEYILGGTYLSGAYSDYNYEANIGYVTVKYKF